MNVSEFVAVFPPNLRPRIETVNAVADETTTQSLTAIGRGGYSFLARGAVMKAMGVQYLSIREYRDY
jgi:hypothetical protein